MGHKSEWHPEAATCAARTTNAPRGVRGELRQELTLPVRRTLPLASSDRDHDHDVNSARFKGGATTRSGSPNQSCLANGIGERYDPKVCRQKSPRCGGVISSRRWLTPDFVPRIIMISAKRTEAAEKDPHDPPTIWTIGLSIACHKTKPSKQINVLKSTVFQTVRTWSTMTGQPLHGRRSHEREQ